MKDQHTQLLIVLPCLVLILGSGVVGCSKSQPPDPVAWQQRVHELTKDLDPGWWKPGSTAALVQFGYDYCAQHDRQRSNKEEIDQSTVSRLREELVSKGVPVAGADGVVLVDTAAGEAQKTLCP